MYMYSGRFYFKSHNTSAIFDKIVSCKNFSIKMSNAVKKKEKSMSRRLFCFFFCAILHCEIYKNAGSCVQRGMIRPSASDSIILKGSVRNADGEERRGGRARGVT